MGIELTKGQVLGAYQGEKWYHEQNKQVFVIEGPPGTGKTFMVLYLVEQLGLKMNEVLFLTYMGKAANQLGKHGLPARTIDSTIYSYEKTVERDPDGKVVLGPTGKPKTRWERILKPKLKKGVKLIIVDEYGMVDKRRGEDLMSFGIPIIALGDRNQLDPPFGTTFWEDDPDVTLTEIMRQSEDSPIVYISQQIIHDRPLRQGVYGNSMIIDRRTLEPMHLKNSDIVITQTNKLRYRINLMFRENFRQYRNLERLHIGEKVICKRNNWKEKVDKFYLTNGTTGIIEDVESSSLNGKTVVFNFQADYLNRPYKTLLTDYSHFFATPEENLANPVGYTPGVNLFEFAYAITTYSSQGSEWDNVLCFDEAIGSKEDRKKMLYTAVTRARNSVTVVLR